MTRAVVEACPDLFAVQLCCIGDDSVDKQACADHGVLVFNDPVSNGRSVVEMVIAHLISLSRRLFETDPNCRQGIWEKNNTERYEIKGKTLGILGLGNIGRQVARAAEALGMRIRFFDSRYAATEVGTEFGWEAAASIEDLMAGSDYVTVHFSARNARGQSNDDILDEALLKALGRDRPADSPRIFLNLGRGFLHTPEALISAIDAGVIRRAAVGRLPCRATGKGVMGQSVCLRAPCCRHAAYRRSHPRGATAHREACGVDSGAVLEEWNREGHGVRTTGTARAGGPKQPEQSALGCRSQHRTWYEACRRRCDLQGRSE